MQEETGLPAGKQTKVGFIGLGEIGSLMAANMIKGGFDVSALDLRASAVEKAVELGARAARSGKAMATECSAISIAVVSDAQVDELVSGPDGIFENAKPGTVILAHSTMPPMAAAEFEKRAEEKGLCWLDAPMSGATIAAQAGTLTFLIGGRAEVLERCRPILNSMGTNIFHLGKAGNGQVAKLVNGLMLHIGYAVALEGLKLAEAYGVPEEQIIALARLSTGKSWVVDNWGHMDREVAHHTQGTERMIQTHMRRDIHDALIAAKAVNTSMPIAGVTMEVYADLMTNRFVRRSK